MKIRNRFFEGHTYVMGILNVTPDSFSDGGKWMRTDAALKRAERMIYEGAAVIDIGGESSRPGSTAVSESEEIERIAPVIEAVRRNFDIPISVDTCKSKVADAALGAGADMVNDILGFKGNDGMARVVKKHGASCCLMHNRRKGGYTELLKEVSHDLRECAELAEKAGIDRDRIILDPGIGFAKTAEENLYITGRLGYFHSLGYPLLLGASRKSMIGYALGLPVKDRLEGTLVTTVFAALNRYLFVRVHDIKENVRAVKMTEALTAENETEVGKWIQSSLTD